MKKVLLLTLMASAVGGLKTMAADTEQGRDGGVPAWLAEFDRDADGVLDEAEKKEARAARRDRRKARYRGIDTNRDGEISPAERKAAIEALRIRIEAYRTDLNRTESTERVRAPLKVTR